MSEKQAGLNSAIVKAIRPHLVRWAERAMNGTAEECSQALKDAKAAADQATVTYRDSQKNPPASD